MSLQETLKQSDMPENIVLLPGQGRTLLAGGSRITLKATGQDTGGAWSLTEFTLPAHFVEAAPPLHTHTREDEVFSVLQGMVKIQLGDQIIEAPAGSFILGRKNTPHRFSNPYDTPVLMQIISSPAGLENFFVDLYEQLQSNPTDVQSIIALFQKYGMQINNLDQKSSGRSDIGSTTERRDIL